MTGIIPKISIVTPSYNQGRFLEKTILSVLSQQHRNVEYLVIDGGSTDNSVGIIKKYADRLAFWESIKDSGQSQAINKGFRRATGDIFAWINSDDLLMPWAAAVAASFFDNNPSAGLLFGDRLIIDQNDNVLGTTVMPDYYRSMLNHDQTLPQETVFFRRSVFQKVGGLDETLHFSMDFDLWCKMSRVAEIHHVPLFLGMFRQHKESKSLVFSEINNASAAKYKAEHATVFRRHFNAPIPTGIRRRAYKLYHALISVQYRFSQDRLRALRLYQSLNEPRENEDSTAKSAVNQV